VAAHFRVILEDNLKDDGDMITLEGVTGPLSFINDFYGELIQPYCGKPTFKSEYVFMYL
jgi:hypothetical protein